MVPFSYGLALEKREKWGDLGKSWQNLHVSQVVAVVNLVLKIHIANIIRQKFYRGADKYSAKLHNFRKDRNIILSLLQVIINKMTCTKILDPLMLREDHATSGTTDANQFQREKRGMRLTK